MIREYTRIVMTQGKTFVQRRKTNLVCEDRGEVMG